MTVCPRISTGPLLLRPPAAGGAPWADRALWAGHRAVAALLGAAAALAPLAAFHCSAHRRYCAGCKLRGGGGGGVPAGPRGLAIA